MWQRLRQSYPPQFEIIPLFLLSLILYQVWSQYSSLPDRVPSHFNLQGIPDRWGSRNEVLVYPVAAAFIYIISTVANLLIASSRDPMQYINLPSKWKAAMTDAQAESLRIFVNRWIFVLKMLLQGLVAYSLYMTIEIALGRATGLGLLFDLLLTAILALVAFMLWKTLRIIRTPGRGQDRE